MPRMRAIDAAAAVLRKEGVGKVFGVPGAAINPFYSAMKRQGGFEHVLARHVEGASHMAEGYTRARAGNIGVCIGTSGPAGTDMITGLYSAWADSIPILCITGQAPRARLHKEDFQAVDIEAVAKPVTKWAVTVREPALVPRVFQQAFHIMRSGRPGPVLIDLPFDVQMAEIEFDIDTYVSLPVYKPAATRAQAEKALAMLNEAERPVIVCGGGVINADAAARLQEFAEIVGVPVIPTLMGWGAIPDDHPLMAGMAGLQTSHRYGNATLLASDFVIGIGNRWANRHAGSVEVYTSTCADALEIVRRYGIALLAGARRLLESGAGETVKPGDPRLARVSTRIVASPQMALEAAAAVARAAGVTPLILGDSIEGEAREVAKVIAGIALQARRHAQPLGPPCVLLSGGETTVTVRGRGRGGRNVEFLLALGLALDGAPGIHALAADTDGVDGAEEVAGAFLAPDTLARARARGMRPRDCLDDNDGHGFFGALGDALVTGPTLTNVNDFRAILVT